MQKVIKKLKVIKVNIVYERPFLQEEIPKILSIDIHKKNMKETKFEN